MVINSFHKIFIMSCVLEKFFFIHLSTYFTRVKKLEKSVNNYANSPISFVLDESDDHKGDTSPRRKKSKLARVCFLL